MTRTIRSEFVLPALQILLDPQRTDFTQAVFRMAVGDSSPNEVARCSLADLGLPPTLSGLNPVDEETLTIPPAVLDALARATEGLGESAQLPHDALWLEFPSPAARSI